MIPLTSPCQLAKHGMIVLIHLIVVFINETIPCIHASLSTVSALLTCHSLSLSCAFLPPSPPPSLPPSNNHRVAAVVNGLSKLSKASKCLLQSLSVQMPLHLYQEEVVQPFSTKLTPIPTTFIQPPS